MESRTDGVPPRLGSVTTDKVNVNSSRCAQHIIHHKASSFELDPSIHGTSATLQPQETPQFHNVPLGRVLTAKKELPNNLTSIAESADQQPNVSSNGEFDEDIRQELFDSYPYKPKARDKHQHGSTFTLLIQAVYASALTLLSPKRQPSSDKVAELGYDSDDSDNPTPYWLEADMQKQDGEREKLLVSTDTGSDGTFLFSSALEKIGPLDMIPIPTGRLKAYVNPLDHSKTTTPQYYVNLRLHNRSVDLNDIIKLKVIDVPEGSNGYDVVFGYGSIAKLGGNDFLDKVVEAHADGPELAANHVRNNWFGALLKVKTSTKKQLTDKRNDNKLREQNSETATKLYATSGVLMQPSATPSGERSQSHSASFPSSATWHSSAQQPNALPYGSLAAQQRSLDHSPPVPDYRGEFASHRTGTSSSQFTENTQFSVPSRRSTASSASSWSTVPAHGDNKLAAYAVDYAVPQGSLYSVHQQKQ